MPKVKDSPVKNTGIILLAGTAAAVVAAIYLSSRKGTTKTATIVFKPIAGSVGTVIAVTGKDWQALDTIKSVTIGPSAAENTLKIDNKGNLSGSIIVPSVMMTEGIKDIVITFLTEGPKLFKNAFTVTKSTTTGGWILMTATAKQIAVGKAIGAEGWLLMTPTGKTLTVARAIGAEGWELMTPTGKTLTVARAIGTEGWLLMTPTGKTLTIARAIGAEGWELMTDEPTILSVGKPIPVLTCDPFIYRNGTLNFAWSGFTPNSSVWVEVYTIGGASFSTDDTGNGKGALDLTGLAPGWYGLHAWDETNSAWVPFEIWGP